MKFKKVISMALTVAAVAANVAVTALAENTAYTATTYDGESVQIGNRWFSGENTNGSAEKQTDGSWTYTGSTGKPYNGVTISADRNGDGTFAPSGDDKAAKATIKFIRYHAVADVIVAPTYGQISAGYYNTDNVNPNTNPKEKYMIADSTIDIIVDLENAVQYLYENNTLVQTDTLTGPVTYYYNPQLWFAQPSSYATNPIKINYSDISVTDYSGNVTLDDVKYTFLPRYTKTTYDGASVQIGNRWFSGTNTNGSAEKQTDGSWTYTGSTGKPYNGVTISADRNGDGTFAPSGDDKAAKATIKFIRYHAVADVIVAPTYGQIMAQYYNTDNVNPNTNPKKKYMIADSTIDIIVDLENAVQYLYENNTLVQTDTLTGPVTYYYNPQLWFAQPSSYATNPIKINYSDISVTDYLGAPTIADVQADFLPDKSSVSLAVSARGASTTQLLSTEEDGVYSYTDSNGKVFAGAKAYGNTEGYSMAIDLTDNTAPTVPTSYDESNGLVNKYVKYSFTMNVHKKSEGQKYSVRLLGSNNSVSGAAFASGAAFPINGAGEYEIDIIVDLKNKKMYTYCNKEFLSSSVYKDSAYGDLKYIQLYSYEGVTSEENSDIVSIVPEDTSRTVYTQSYTFNDLITEEQILPYLEIKYENNTITTVESSVGGEMPEGVTILLAAYDTEGTFLTVGEYDGVNGVLVSDADAEKVKTLKAFIWQMSDISPVTRAFEKEIAQ